MKSWIWTSRKVKHILYVTDITNRHFTGISWYFLYYVIEADPCVPTGASNARKERLSCNEHKGQRSNYLKSFTSKHFQHQVWLNKLVLALDTFYIITRMPLGFTTSHRSGGVPWVQVASPAAVTLVFLASGPSRWLASSQGQGFRVSTHETGPPGTWRDFELLNYPLFSLFFSLIRKGWRDHHTWVGGKRICKGALWLRESIWWSFIWTALFLSKATTTSCQSSSSSSSSVLLLFPSFNPSHETAEGNRRVFCHSFLLLWVYCRYSGCGEPPRWVWGALMGVSVRVLPSWFYSVGSVSEMWDYLFVWF